MYLSNNTLSVSEDKLYISTEDTTIPASPLPFLNKNDLDTTLKDIIDSLNGKIDKQDAKIVKQHEELFIITTMSLFLTEDTKALK